MDKLQIQAKTREVNKLKPEKLRKAGQLPAVLYGNKLKNLALTVDAREFDKIFKKAGESTIVNLVTEDGQTHPVLIQDVQIHYLTSQPIHVDFYEVSMSQKLKAKVALEFVGESSAVKTLGAVLVKVLNEVEVECLPADLPHNITVSLDALKTLQDTVHAKDLVIPAKVKLLTAVEELVVKVQPPRDVEAELAAPVVEDVSKVEGAAEVKPEAEAGAKTEGEDKKAKEEKPAKGGEEKK